MYETEIEAKVQKLPENLKKKFWISLSFSWIQTSFWKYSVTHFTLSSPESKICHNF
ncbi:MAG: hypothetical protein PVF58_08830 [Candidatus Methanofastidiosia archaeon]